MSFLPGMRGLITAPAPPSGGGYSTEAQQFFDRITDPGTTRKDAYAAIIDTLVADGIWAKLDCLWILAADIAGNAVVNLKSSSFTLTPTNSPTFNADQGYTGNGSNMYLATGYTPSTAGGNLTLNSAHISAWCRSSASSSAYIAGVRGASSDYFGFEPYHPFGGGNSYSKVFADNGPSTASASAAGFWCANRSGASACQYYKNGSSIATGSDASDTLIASEIRILGSGGSSPTYSTFQVSAASIGSSLDATEQGDLYAALNDNKWW